MTKLELLIPAGNREKLEVAVAYGADAVYFGCSEFSLRRRAGNFSRAETAAAIACCREHGVKAYLAVNLLPYNADLIAFADYLKGLQSLPPDALIVGDPGVITLCREYLPSVSLHLSTQANTLNYRAASFWRKNGVSRINLARELSLHDIAEVVRQVPELEFEVFVHGAMCMAYSGRCLLSLALTGRHANRGDCAQPCRWGYALQEETRPGEYMALEEDERGSYIFNAKDLCLISRLPELKAAGIHSVKIEGRMKSAYYVAAVTRVYRRALDQLARSPKTLFSPDQLEKWKNELTRVSHRRYTEGFIDGDQDRLRDLQHCDSSAYLRNYRFCALVLEVVRHDCTNRSCLVRLNVKDRLQRGAKFEVIAPEMDDFITTILSLQKESGESVIEVHPGTVALARCQGLLAPYHILRQPVTDAGVAI
ncbi:MAG: U32 family peptidase C-terminal domain-containing protein [Pseudomonadota bacterium]|nr:U32 family peptidase C-terminal domain-containing protein [Pseudomonadota bacterium]